MSLYTNLSTFLFDFKKRIRERAFKNTKGPPHTYPHHRVFEVRGIERYPVAARNVLRAAELRHAGNTAL